jgi:3-methyl-2-oxobutanoate hydroxymethyltransferase
MLHHARAVSRGASRPLRIGDLPFMSYQADAAEAVRNAGRFLAEGGMDAVKLEGGRAHAATAAAIVRAGIPVMGHVGLTPQSVHALGGFRVQGRTAEAARAILDDALALEDAGCFSVVLEGVPDRVAAHVTERLRIPTIGIGAGGGTTGQVLVFHDLAGFTAHPPRFVRRFGEAGAALEDAVRGYADAVRSRAFPAAEHAYVMPDEEWRAFLELATRPAPAPEPARPKAARRR